MFTDSMIVVMQAIWELRVESGGRRALNHSEVERKASAMMKLGSVSRQNWYNKKAKVEWRAIKRAIEGVPPLAGEEMVEEYLLGLNGFDRSGSLARKIQLQNSEISRLSEKCADLQAQIQKGLEKSRQDQYVSGRFLLEYERYKEGYESMVMRLNNIEMLRDGLMVKNEELKAENRELKDIVGSAEGGHGGDYLIFEPDCDFFGSANDDSQMLIAYSEGQNRKFLQMLDRARRDGPCNICLVFHKFHSGLVNFVREKIPTSKKLTTYVFFVYEPIREKRMDFYLGAYKCSYRPPFVAIVLEDYEKENVLNFTHESKYSRLKKIANKNKFFGYDVEVESYENVIIHRKISA